MKTQFTYTCPECDTDSEIVCTLGTPASGMYGPPETYDPGCGDEFSKESCPHCNAEWDLDVLSSFAADQAACDRDDALQAKADAAEDRRERERRVD